MFELLARGILAFPRMKGAGIMVVLVASLTTGIIYCPYFFSYLYCGHVSRRYVASIIFIRVKRSPFNLTKTADVLWF